jgi:hypothetical protein
MIPVSDTGFAFGRERLFVAAAAAGVMGRNTLWTYDAIGAGGSGSGEDTVDAKLSPT